MTKLSFILRIVLIVLMAVSGIFIILFYFGSAVQGTEGTEFYEPTITEGMLKWTYILFFVAIAAAVGFPLAYSINNPESAKKTGLAILFLGVVVLVAYLLADNTVLTIPGYKGEDNVPQTLKWAGTGLLTMYLLLGIAILTIIGTEVAKIIKR
ncbi:MAG: hypothetical protein GVY19_05730 [Bacteroidetes bacterium]|jgi:hypothetical protein|nr:hypothetical protein [Bacteroidota bacterium]